MNKILILFLLFKNFKLDTNIFFLKKMKKSIHTNLKNSKNNVNEVNLNSCSNDNLRNLNVNWQKIFQKYYSALIVDVENRFTREFTDFLNENYSIFLVFSTRFASNIFELQSLSDDFRTKLPKSGTCGLCKTEYKGLKTHFLNCYNKVLKNFTDKFFSVNYTSDKSDLECLPYFCLSDDELNILNSTEDSLPSHPGKFDNYLFQLANFCNLDNLNILHLNINSVESKLTNIDSILSANIYDVIVLSESKLDYTTSKNFGKGYGYQVLRRDRNSHGGGLLIFINGKLKVASCHNSPDFELIHFQLFTSFSTLNIICTYKPPEKNENVNFFMNLEDYLFTIDPNLPLLIIGDLNEDLLSNRGLDLSKFMDQYELKNCIDKPTRIKGCRFADGFKFSKSLLDVCLHNSLDDFGISVKSDVVGCPFSDHCFICVALEIKCIEKSSEPIFGRNLNPTKVTQIIDELKKINFSDSFKFIETYRQWGYVKGKILRVIDRISPLKCLKKNKKNNRRSIRFDNELAIVAKNRDFYYSVATTRDQNVSEIQRENSWKLHVEYRNKFNKLFRKKLSQSVDDQLKKGFSNSTAKWKFYSNFIITKKSENDSDFPDFLVENGEKITNRLEMPNVFNGFFTGISSNSLAAQSDCTTFIDELFRDIKRSKKVNIPGFSFQKFYDFEIIKAINELALTSSPGVTGIPIKIMKEISYSLAPILTEIFNKCLSTGIIPDEWKTAVVTPLFKNKGCKSELNNYRGISVLPPINKVFEVLLSNQIRSYFESNNIFSTAQHGFRKNYSCETALHELLSDINYIRDRNKIAILLFIDFKKAFDTVDADLLIRKLFHYGFDNSALSLIRNYFYNRKQFVKMGNYSSIYKKIKLGVPQGSVLGPVFFLIFINDITFVLEHLKCKLFADDTTIYYDGDKLDELLLSFNRLLTPFFNWCNLNRLDINWDKTFCMIITKKKIKGLKEINNVLIGDSQVKVVDKFKLLGVTIDSQLDFEFYVSVNCTRLKSFSFSR